MRSSDDTLYITTVRQAPRPRWGGKPQAPNRTQDPRRRENPKPGTPNQNLWALPGIHELC